MAEDYNTHVKSLVKNNRESRFIDSIENAPYILSRGISYSGAAGNSSHSNSGSGGTTGCNSNSRSDKRLEEIMK